MRACVRGCKLRAYRKHQRENSICSREQQREHIEAEADNKSSSAATNLLVLIMHAQLLYNIISAHPRAAHTHTDHSLHDAFQRENQHGEPVRRIYGAAQVQFNCSPGARDEVYSYHRPINLPRHLLRRTHTIQQSSHFACAIFPAQSASSNIFKHERAAQSL